ncbi:sulfate transporter family-domain-containing protein, partial [Powellomyces hirtus]
IATIPAVILALILNLLDAMSYGIIIFPTAESYIPDTAIQSGISMFLASTVISQLIYTLGGSAFTGAVGSMMIEVMPFLHIICRTISNEMQGASHHSILATVMVAYAMSTLLTGFVFLMLGIFKLGNLVQFFPRHILVGCIGGIGLFLILTGVEVTTGITTAYTWEYLRAIFEPSELKLWGSSFGLAVFLKMMQRRIHHPLFVPLFYVCVPILFYIIVFAGRFALEDVRKAGWLISLPEGPPAAFYEFWTYYDFSAVNWKAVPATIPTQLALAFFGILHVPINVPALAVSTHQDVDLNRELIGHGISNLVSGCFGATQNYLVYSNSLLYIRSGGNSVTGGLMLALGTAVVWIAGGKVIGFVPTIVVGSLIFHLGIDLLKESVWDTWNTGIHMLEYMTIISIVTIMGVVGFTEGILTGVVLACVFFVVMYARRSVVRATYTGSQLRSTVHRLYRQQYFLDQVGEQIHVIKLQGFMFFGTINQLDIHIANALKTDSRIRYIVVDFSLIYGIDYSALESFHRIKRMLRERRTHLVFAGLTTVGKTLAQSGILDEEESDASDETLVHAFEDINEALEWCENQLLVTYYHKMVARDDAANKKTDTRGVFGLTPRQKDVHQAASLVLTAAPVQPPVSTETFLPVASLLQAFSEPGDYDPELLHFCEGKFERVEIKKGTILWVPGEDPKELYVVHEGELLLMIKDNEARAPEGAMKIVETLLPGTMVGELELFSNRPRTCRLVANSDAVIWRLSKESCDELAEADPKLMLKFVTKIALGFDAVRFYNTVYHWAQLK